MSDFAKKQMMKHGWVEGKGLGKNEDGITKPIKSMIKSDYGGLGYKESSDKSWEKVYNSAVKNIQVESRESEVSLNVVDDDWDLEFNLSKFKKKKKKLGTQLGYENFQKSSILYNGCLVQDDSATSEEEGETAQDLVNVSSFVKDSLISAKPILRIASKPLCMAKLDRIALQDQSLLNVTRESYENNMQPLTFPAICRFASLDLMPTWMMCNSFKKEDKDKTNNNIITFQSLQQTVAVKSKSRTKRYRKKISNLADQLSACSIKEIDKESKCDSLNDKNSLRKVKKCNRKKESLKIKCKPECLQLMKKHNIQPCTTKEENASEQTRGQDKKESVQLVEKDDIPFYKHNIQPCTTKEERCKPPTDIKNNIKNIVYLKKCLKKQKNRRRRRPRIWEVINNIANKSDTNIDTVAKALTKIHLSEDVSITIKKKPTQTHITPV